jgi:hypothetical protein
MSNYEPLGGRPSFAGNQYQHFQVTDGARAHLGDTYNISKLLVEKEVEYYSMRN